MKKITGVGAIACLLAATGAQAAVTNIDGQAGGGIVPWALLSSGPTVAYTHITTQNLNVDSLAVNTSFANRVEVSYARNMLNVNGTNATAVGGLVGANSTDNVDNFGIKVKLNDMGDSMPQFAIGAVYKKVSGNLYDNVLKPALGVNNSGTDIYAAASKILNMGKTVLLNGVIRATKADELGLLGFGGGVTAGAPSGYKLVPEVSAEVFAASNVVVGAEYRKMPNFSVAGATDGVLHPNSAYDFHVVYVANKTFTLTAAYANLGEVAPAATNTNRQNGLFLQGQVNF